ncbi:cysteine proteinase [Atractiella rhizophila]|nr:cysteine proteinase [Atractiella rhizophila]
MIEDGPSPQPSMEVEPPLSVEDEEAFAAKYLHDLGPEQEDFKVFHWRISNYRKLDKKAWSPTFECGGHKWNILLFPLGNSNGQATDMVSVYLNYGDPKEAPEGWHVCAQFSLAISNAQDPTVYMQSHAHHRFTQEEQDWGFTRFVELRKLWQTDGRARPIIENDETVISAFIRVLKDPTGVLWHNFQNYDSKKETGFVGMKNQGATCYLNSLLQSLFLTHTYRKAVYQIPTDNDSLDSVALALQRVFYLLQTSDLSVGTTELTKSFGWRGLDSFLQHDVQEFNRVLQDKLETKMKGTKADGATIRLFGGKMRSYIKCINVDYESSRSEDFYDIQLNVKGMKNVEESFQDYIAEETMDGENKYQAEGHGLQDAKKGVIFQSFPPVLHLQLKRFEYDIQRDANIKINDRYEFPFSMDLAPYLDSDVDQSEPWIYDLYGVLVHSGDVHGGHYFVLIKPDIDGKWLKFDDDRVVRVTDKEVLEDNFGGEMINGTHLPGKPPVKGAQKRFTNAYMLVYIRRSRAPEILAPLKEEDTPAHLRARLEKEKKDADMKRKEREEQHLYLTTKIITDNTFQTHEGFDLATFDDRGMPASELPSYRVLKQQPFLEFKGKIAEDMGLDATHVRLWVLVNRQNKTVRPDAPVPDNDQTLTMEVVRDKMASRQQDLKLYLEYMDPTIKTKWASQMPQEAPIMIFVKHFDIKAQTLKGIGHFYVHRHMKVSDLVPLINEHMGLHPATTLKIFEEIKPNMIEQMKLKATFLQSEIQDGDIVCFQVEMPEREPNLITSPVQFYDYFLNRVLVAFKPKLEDTNYPEFELLLSKKNSYDQVATKVGEYLKHDPMKLRFTTATSQGVPKTVVKRQANMTLSEIIQPSYMSAASNLLFYELLDVSIIELETKRNLRITWMGSHNREEGVQQFLLPKTTSVSDLADQLAKVCKLSPGSGPRIRVFETTSNNRQQKQYGPSELIRDIHPEAELFAEEIPEDEFMLDEADKVINVFHYTKEPSRPHGVPFRFVLKPGEPFSETKKRLQVRTGTSDKELAKMKFGIVMAAPFKQPSPISDEDVLYDHKWAVDDYLGLDHLDRTTKRTGEKAVVIKG